MQLAKTMAALERLRDGGRAVPVRPVRPDHRRRLRLVRGGRGRQHRRAERPHRVRRRARLGRDDRPGAAAGLPARRVPVQPRVHRPDRGPAPTCATSSPQLLRLLPRPSGRARPPVPSTRTSPASGRCRSCPRSPSGWRGARPATASDAHGQDGSPTPLDRRRSEDAVWARVQLARNLRRPRTLEFVAAMTDDFVELHGDRLFGDDAAIVAGLRPPRRAARRRHRPAEGRRHRGEHPAQLRDAPPRGLPQGDAGHGAGRALRPADRDLRGRARRPSRTRSPRSAASPRRSPGPSG